VTEMLTKLIKLGTMFLVLLVGCLSLKAPAMTMKSKTNWWDRPAWAPVDPLSKQISRRQTQR